MGTFTGEYKRSVDEKGRVYVPYKIRKRISKENTNEICQVFNENTQTIECYPSNIFQKIAEEYGKKSKDDENRRDLSRRTEISDMDDVGRIQLHSRFRGDGIKRVSFNGNLDYFEIRKAENGI